MRGRTMSSRALILCVLWIVASSSSDAATDPCQGVETRPLETQLQSGNVSAVICNFNISAFACLSSSNFTNLTSADLTALLTCKLPSSAAYSKEIWVLFIKNFATSLDAVLDNFSNMTLNITGSKSNILDAISEVIFSNFNTTDLANSSLITKWFQSRLRPFLSSVSTDLLVSLSAKNFSCQTFQIVVDALSTQEMAMTVEQKWSVVRNFTYPFLLAQQKQGQSCVQSASNDSDWLVRNFGKFSKFASFSDFISLKSDFNGLNATEVLTPSQLAELCSEPSRLRGPQDVNRVMAAINPNQFASFFSQLSPNIQKNESRYSSDVKNTFLQNILQRGGLSSPALNDSEVLQWVNVLLTPFLSSLSSADVTPYFNIIRNQTCNTSQIAISKLDALRSAFSNDTQVQIRNNIQQLFAGPNGLRCYSSGSFFVFLKSFFLNFGLPDLSGVLSIIPANRQKELLNSISPGELSEFLNGTNTVGNGSDLCTFLNNYNRTNQYLEKEPVVSAAVGRQTLACVWSRALSASSQDEVDQWFNVRLGRYLPFLSSQLINSTQLSGASCLSYRKLVTIMGGYNYSNVDFTQEDVYQAIKNYLTTDFAPKCYNTADPLLNSTSWFVDYLGFFISFVSLEDLNTFGGLELQSFTLDMTNLKLFQQYNVKEEVMIAYVEMLYEMNSDFSASLLPGVLQCFAPATGFTALDSSASVTVLDSLETYCSSIDPTVSAALAENMGSVTSSSIAALGNSSTGLSIGQISSTSPAVLSSSLSVLSNVNGWSQAQTLTIVHTLLNSGVFKITSSSSLLQLGTLVTGVPSTVFTTVQPTELLKAVQSASFLTSITNAPSVTQQTIVYQLITLDSSSDAVVNMIPGSLATLIPRNSLLSVSASSAATINQKQWKYEQAMLFFDAVAGAITDEDSISATVMQGFTCTRVQTFPLQKVHKLIKGCRRRNNFRIVLQEAQLTCMYNNIQWTSVTNFTNYPPELLLYYDYSLMNQSLCQDYFTALGFADFTVLSNDMSYRKQILLINALQCLKISGTTLNRAQLDVLGNLTCFLGSSYILDSDPYVLEKLKPCQSFSKEQISAMEKVLLTKNTEYGAPVNWTVSTLNKLGILPLYFTSNIWVYFTAKDKSQFFKTFLPPLRENRALYNDRITSIMNEARKMSKTKTRMSHRIKRDTACTVGDITQVQANDNSFPFDYDVTQFNVCLSVQTLKDNLAAISQKVVGSEYQRVILDKLNQAYPSGISDEVLQVLGPASRNATVTDISKWNITKVDTLSALMKSSDGNWTSDQVKAVVSRYLAVGGNSLGRSELNALGGVNLCALDISTLNTITSTNLQSAGSLSVSTCSLAQKQVLFGVAQTAFSDKALNTPRASTPVSTNAYQLIQTYLGGASLAYVQNLAASNISMDMPTFLSLNPAVINALTVSEVKALLGNVNLADLKRYENNTLVQNWVRLQPQVQLDALAIGLTGGTASNSTTVAPAASIATTANANAATATTGSGSRVQALPRLQLLVLLWVVMATLKLMH